MNLTSVKNLSELHLNGIKITWVREDKTVKEVRLHDGNGGKIVIKSAGNYQDALKIMIPQPYETEERYLLSGDLAGLTNVREYFTDKYAAEDKLREYAEKVRGEHGLSVTKVMAQIDDGGNVVEETDRSASKTEADDIPF